MSDYNAKNIKNSILHFLMGRFVAVVIGLGFFTLIARNLTLDDFGFFVFLWAMLEILLVISSVGSFPVAERYLPELNKVGSFLVLKKLIQLLLIYRVVLLVVFLFLISLFSESLLSFLILALDVEIFKLFLFVVFFEGVNRFLQIIFDSFLLQKYSQLMQILRQGTRFLLVAIFLYYNMTFDLSLLVKIEVFSNAVGLVFALTLFLRFYLVLKSKKDLSSRKIGYRRMLKLSLPIYFSSVLSIGYSDNFLKVMLSKFFGVLEVAFFGFASMFMGMMKRYIPVFLLIGILRPLFIAAYNENDNFTKIGTLTNVVIKTNLMVLLPLVMFFSLVGEDLAILIGGGKFIGIGLYMSLFSALLFLQGFRLVVIQLNLALEGGRELLKATYLSYGGLGVVYLLNPLFSQYSFVLGLIASELIFCLVLYSNIKRKGLYSIANVNGISIFIFAGFATFICLFFMKNSYDAVSITGVLGLFIFVFLLFFLILYLFKPFTENERVLIKKIIPARLMVF